MFVSSLTYQSYYSVLCTVWPIKVSLCYTVTEEFKYILIFLLFLMSVSVSVSVCLSSSTLWLNYISVSFLKLMLL